MWQERAQRFRERINSELKNIISKMGTVIWMFISPPKFICWNPNVWCDDIERWGFWEVLWSWGWRALSDGISALIKEASERSLTPCTMWGQSEKALTMNQKEGPNQKRTMLAPWSWLFLVSQTVKNKLWLFINHLAHSVLLQQPELLGMD